MLTTSLRTAAVVLIATILACGKADSPSGDGAGLSGRPDMGASGGSSVMLERPAGIAPPPAAPMPERDLSKAEEQQGQGRDPSQVRAGAADSVSAPTMLVRTGTAQIEVDSLEIAMQQIRMLAQRLGGMVANTQLASGRDQIRSATLQMKIPVARWADALSGLEPIGKVEALNEFTEDVGEEYVDITARVANSQRLEARLIELLGSRTGKLSDVLTVERELARVREEIERYQGRLRYLRNRAQLSTLTVTVHEAFPVVSARGESGVIGDAFKQAWRNFVGFVAGIISFMGILVPVAGLALLGWLAWRRWGPDRPPPAKAQ
jgi:hypothetical protein